MSLVKSANSAAKLVKAYSALTPATKQVINQVAQRTASTVTKQVLSRAGQRPGRQRNSNVQRTRMGQRVYSPSESLTTKAIAPASYATTWQTGARSMRVKQTEVVAFIKAADKTWKEKSHFWKTGDYSVVTLAINPAQPQTFPWLSHIARLYDKYRFHSLRFRYINSVSTQQDGNISFALDYDTLDTYPKSIMEASQLAKYQIGPTYCPQEFNVPVSHPGNNQWLYTYDVNVDSKTVDLKTYNLGNIFVMINGVDHGTPTNLGWLAVDYDVELLDKNPVTDDEIFASKTVDSANVPAKRTRSNIDPADTMSLDVNWTAPSTGLYDINDATLTFSDDVEVGSKIRLGLTLVAQLTNTSGSDSKITYLTIDPTSLPEGVQILENYSPDTTIAASSNAITMGYWNFDIILPETRTLDLRITAFNPLVKFAQSGYTKYCAIAYTYA